MDIEKELLDGEGRVAVQDSPSVGWPAYFLNAANPETLEYK